MQLTANSSRQIRPRVPLSALRRLPRLMRLSKLNVPPCAGMHLMAKKPTRKFIQLSEGELNYAMSRAVVQGDWCFVSGTVGYDYSDGSLPESAAQQAQNTFTNIMAALKAADFELGHTIRVQYTVSDRKYVGDCGYGG